jgi:hypothetical protein
MFVDDTKVQQFQSRICVGINPPNPSVDYPGLPKQISTDPSFAFNFVENGKYVWKSSLLAPGSGTEIKIYDNCVSAPVYRKWKIQSDQSVTVSWKPGTDQITVAGKVDYDHWEAYSSESIGFAWGEGWNCEYSE